MIEKKVRQRQKEGGGGISRISPGEIRRKVHEHPSNPGGGGTG